MVTLSELKSYLKIGDTTQDAFVQTCLDEAIAKVNSRGNRDFRAGTYTDLDIKGNGSCMMYLKQFPISSITTLQYYDVIGTTWVDLISGSGDTIANSVKMLSTGAIELLKGYTFASGIYHKIVYVTVAIGDIDVIEGAVKKVAAVFYMQSKAGVGGGKLGMTSENLGVAGADSSGSFDLEKAVEDALQVVEPYRKMNV